MTLDDSIKTVELKRKNRTFPIQLEDLYRDQAETLTSKIMIINVATSNTALVPMRMYR